MALIKSTAIPSGATDYELEQSLKSDKARNTSLTKTFASAGNRRTFTFSCWVKPCKSETTGWLFEGGDADSDGNRAFLRLETNVRFAESAGQEFTTDAALRDPSAWYHLLLAVDTTQGTSSNRIKFYINGVAATFSTINYPSQNHEYGINKAAKHSIGRTHIDSGHAINAYLSEVNFIDGQALTPADFGKTGTYGEWKPIEYSGSYGTNGFYLPFKQDYTVEGFSTVIYTGNGATNHYIGGTGFQPDLLWVKKRSASGTSHMINDSVRGAGRTLYGQLNYAESALSTSNITAFNTDGFSLGTGGSVNDNGSTFVAWNWDMSNPASNVGSTGIQFDNSDDDIVFELGTALGTGSFTVEYWTYFDSLQNYDTIFSTTRSTTGFNAGTDANGMAVWYSVGDDRILESASGTYATGQWYHTAYVRNGTTLKVYVNGVEKDSATDNNDYSEQTASVGALDGASEFSGIILDSLRVSNVARYTSNNFETPQARFTSDSNTLFLLNAPSESSTTLTDSSSNSLSLTITGTSVVSPSGSKPAFTNTDGSITSTVRANSTYGQSIVSYTGTGANATVGHGLSSAPEMVILKRRNAAGDDWAVNMSNISGISSSAHHGKLNSSVAFFNNNSIWFNNTNPSSTLISLGSHATVNASSATMIAYCFHSVTGYSKFGSFSGNGSTTNAITTGFEPAFVMLKRTDTANDWIMIDNVRADVSGTDDNELHANANIAEQNDERLDFTSTGFTLKSSAAAVNASGGTYIYAAFADKREYAYWLDQSGNNNDWTSNNLTESDISVDSPTNNFCTWNPVSNSAGGLAALSEGNLRYNPNGTSSASGMFGTIGVNSGKWYFEVYRKTAGNNYHTGIAGYSSAGLHQYHVYAGQYYYGDNNTTMGWASPGANGEIISCAFDLDNNKIWFARNNVWKGSGNPSAGSGQTDTLNANMTGVSAYTKHGNASYTGDDIHNFGQDSSFAGNKTAQGNQDGNEIGDFYYTPPTGFLALCTKNLPDVAVVPSKHFNTILYTGDGASTHAVTGVGFQPDWVWLKHRTATYHHSVWDSVRGVHKQLYISGTHAEADESTSVKSFDTDGFTLGNKGNVNNDSGAADNFLAWNWKAGTSSNLSAGGARSIATVSSVNVDAGFEIITYTGSGTAGNTIGHSLGVVPNLLIIRRRNAANTWTVYLPPAVDHTKKIHLEVSDAVAANGTTLNSTAPTASVISLGSDNRSNGSGDTYVIYAFAEKDGYSKFGSYTGNGNADGTFVYTGFRPAFVMIKPSSRTGHWMIANNKSSPSNVVDKVMLANDTAAEYTDPSADCKKDFFSNGFKIRTTDDNTNENNATYIYLAFASVPFKFSNAR